MTSSTSWSYNDVDLSTFGEVTMVDEYLDTSEKRGDNQVISFRHGAIFVRKYFNERNITFGIAIKNSSAALLEQTFDSMKALFSSTEQKVLSNTRADASIRTALASMEGTMQVKRDGALFARCIITFKLADPFFRGATLVEEDPLLNIGVSPTLMTVENPGTVQECNPTITLIGPLQDTIIENTTNGCTLIYDGILPDGDTIIISMVDGEYQAVLNGVTNVIGSFSHSGSSFLMVLETGENEFEIIDSDETTGKIIFSFYPPYL